MLSRNDKPPDIRDTRGISGNVFVNPPASSSSPCPQGFNPWTSVTSEHTSPHVTSERQTPDTALGPRWQSGPSVSQKCIRPLWGKIFKELWSRPTKTADFGSSFDKSPNPATFACWKIRFKTEVCICSQFPTEAMLWIKEVEMIESVDDLKSSRSITGTHDPEFEVLDAKMASALNKIIQKYPLQEKGLSGGKWKLNRRPLPPSETDRLPDLRVHPGHWSQWFCRELCRPIYSCCLKWWFSGIRFEMRRNYHEQWLMTYILESLYKLRIRESEKLKAVLDFVVQYEDSSEESWTWLSQIGDNGKKKYRGKFTKEDWPETEIMIQAPWSRIRGQNQRDQRSLGDCWQWKANGQCSKGDNCSFWHDTNKRATSTQPNLSLGSSTQQNVKNASRTRSPTNRNPSGRMARLPCKDHLKGTRTNPLCEKWHPPECLFYKTENGCRFGEKCSYAHRQVDEQPSKRLKKEWWQKCSGYVENYTTIGLRISRCGAAEVFIYFSEELKHTETNPMCSIQ